MWGRGKLPADVAGLKAEILRSSRGSDHRVDVGSSPAQTHSRGPPPTAALPTQLPAPITGLPWWAAGVKSGCTLGSPPQKRPSGPPPSHGGAPGPSPPGGQSLTQVLLRSPAAWPLRVFTPLPQLWGLGHPRQPWYPGPQQGPQKPVGPVGSTFWCVHSLPQPAVTLSLSARGTGPRLGQRFRAALTKLLSWEQAACQISGPALV